MRPRQFVKIVAKYAAPTLAVAGVAYLILDHAGYIDQWRGIDALEAVAARFDLSYAAGASQPLRPNDSEWPAVMTLIYRYSKADLPHDRQPKVLARFAAAVSGVIGPPENPVGEWTAPGTPLALLYVEWPGQTVDKTDFRIVGTIGEFHQWIEQDRADFKFLFYDVALGLLLAIAALLSV